MDFSKVLSASATAIPGLKVFELAVHGDNRGWFKENWQREKMLALGLPDFKPVQNNVSYNEKRGTTRGIHAEPWDKFVSVAKGRIFGAWVDLREGATFGSVFTIEMDPTRAVFVPRGVGNAYQTLENDTVYSYLVNDHWSPDSSYTFLNLADESVAIAWPVALSDAELSPKDVGHPHLAEVTPFRPLRTLILGANGQLGNALKNRFADCPDVEFADRSSLDLADPAMRNARPWREYQTIVNAAAYTAVDRAETPEGRMAAWESNVTGVTRLAAVAAENNLTLVHISSDYVFDGSAGVPYSEDAAVAPLGIYGQTKAAGDAIVAALPRHYILRTSWVIGAGANFVRTMKSLALRGVDPAVVCDQSGRLTFTSDIASAIDHLLTTNVDYGTYNLSSSGPIRTWADIARSVFEFMRHDPSRVREVSTEEYFAEVPEPVAPRPAWSVLDLSKIESTGFVPRDGDEALRDYLEAEDEVSAGSRT